MQGSVSIIDHFFKQKRISIPVYQRNYSWKKDNCKQLMDDLEMISNYEDKRRKHFFGSIIYQVDPYTEEYVIIDGQQRITTISLLLAALRDIIHDKPEITDDPKLYDKIDRKLKDQDDGSIFLKPVKKDEAAYNAIITHDVHSYEDSSIVTANYKYFVKSLNDLLLRKSPKDITDAINHLFVILVHLNSSEDDAQMVFESINSTGLNLNEGDKIRNFLLMNHEPKDQTRYYENYWCKIESNVRDISMFFRNYLMAVVDEIPRVSDVYRAFKDMVLSRKDKFVFAECDSPSELDEKTLKNKEKEFYDTIFQEMVRYSVFYDHIENSRLSDISRECSRTMYYINYQKATVTYPFLLRVLNAHDKGELSSEDVESILIVVENYIIRRAICKVPSAALNKIFPALYRSISKFNDPDNFVEILKYVLLEKGGTSMYPSDADVRNNLESMELYNNHNLCPLILSTIEHSTGDTVDTLERYASGELSIEHVMARHKNSAWKAEIGDNYDEVYDTWLHRLGNLTLTAYNSEMSDRSYSEKRYYKDFGFINSGLHLNQCMKEEEHWTEDVMTARNSALVEEFIRRVPFIESTYVVDTQDGHQLFSLDSNDYPSGSMDLIGYSFNGIVHYYKTGIQVFTKFLEELMETDPEKLINAASEKAGRGKLSNWIFTDDSGPYLRPLPYGLYVRNPSHYDQKVMIIRDVLELYGFDPEDSYFICESKNQNSD